MSRNFGIVPPDRRVSVHLAHATPAYQRRRAADGERVERYLAVFLLGLAAGFAAFAICFGAPLQ